MMTQNLSSDDFAALGAPHVVYVRPIKAAEMLAAGVSEQTLREFNVQPEQILYALHSANGARIAVLADKDSAYAAAVAHELAPVSVH